MKLSLEDDLKEVASTLGWLGHHEVDDHLVAKSAREQIDSILMKYKNSAGSTTIIDSYNRGWDDGVTATNKHYIDGFNQLVGNEYL